MRPKSFTKETIKLIKAGGVGVIPTDTIYGIVGSALKPKTVARIYRLRQRNLKKPMIILIGHIANLKLFGISSSSKFPIPNSKTWPAKTSIIFNCPNPKFKYLHRGIKSLAFRLPKSKKLQEFLKKTGPLVAPSANPEGESPAKTIKEAKRYFGSEIDFYIDAGRRISRPSKIIHFENGKLARK